MMPVDHGHTTHARGLLALAVLAGIVVIALLTGCSSDATPRGDDAAPSSAVAAEVKRQRAEPTSEPTRQPGQAPVTAKGANGKTYNCPFTVSGRVAAADARVKRRTTILRTRRAALRKIARKYPNGAPADIVARYETLRASANAQVRWTNRAIRQYNRLLLEACSPQ
jgi:hypothetical protein